MASCIKALRKKLGLTGGQLAEMVGTSAQQISRLETGDRKLTIGWIQKLAPHLGISVGELLIVGAGIPPEKGRFIDDAEALALLGLYESLPHEERIRMVAIQNAAIGGPAKRA